MIGFKSFASRTTIDFRSGIMSVVGPNGCGKTNIVDSIRWVLGEQRTGALRAERMESVIFNGTNHRRPLSMAEVTLTIENDKGILPSPYTEVSITRRLYRSGESEYLINRNPSRLRDIHDLFIDTGLGSSAYSIIELSMVEGIITGNSPVRRNLIEEAAGVAKYKERRNAAQRRLDSTRENLTRINDVYQEIEMQYRALKRQASRARRHQELTTAVQLRIVADLSDEHLTLKNKIIPLEEKLIELENDANQAEADITQANADLLSIEGRDISINEKSRRAQDALRRLERRESENEREKALIQQRTTFFENEKIEADERRKVLTKKFQQSEEQAEQARENAKQLRDDQNKLFENNKSLKIQIDEINSKLDQTRKDTEQKRKAEEETHRKLASLIERAKGRETTKIRLLNQLSSQETHLVKLSGDIQSVNSELSENRNRLNSTNTQMKNTNAHIEVCIADLSKARSQHAEALSEQASIRAAVEAARSTLQAHNARSGSPVKLPDSLSKLAIEKNLRSIAERINCKTEYRTALAAALSDVLDVLDAPDIKTALKIAETVAKDEQADLRFSVDSFHNLQDMQLPHDTDECIIAADLIQNQNGIGDFLKRRLARTILVPDLKKLHILIPWASEHQVRLVTHNGTLFDPDGVLHSGRIDPEALKVGWLSIQNDLKKSLAESEQKLISAEKHAESSLNMLKTAEKNMEETREEMRKVQDAESVCKRQIVNFESDLNRLQKLQEQVTLEIKSVRTEINSMPVDNDGDIELNDMQTMLVNLKELRKKSEEELSLLDARRTEISEERTAATSELARIGERLAAMERALEMNEREVRAANDDLAALNARFAKGDTELEQVKQAFENIVTQAALLERENTELSAAIETLRTQRKEIGEERTKTTGRLNKAQELNRTALKERNKIEAETITCRERLREVNRRLEEEAGVRPEAVSDNARNEALAELEENGFADLSLAQLKSRLQSIGPVNMLALDEIGEVEERHRFLTDQKADLENGIEVLEETIDRINYEARRIFREVFDKVNCNFQEIFRNLFDGGEAQLSLQDGDPLESDIRILATPSGKKMQALAMLSGGEKALTAIALLFAIYKVRPSPFCILDEVDAPLDDANIGRFTKLVREFAIETQFLIVTHNKRTMEAADCLYVDTLGNDGTSSMVTVKIEDQNNDDTTSERISAVV
jgi:chromosome segregation protein